MTKTVFNCLFIYIYITYYSKELTFEGRFLRKYWSRQCFFTDNCQRYLFNSNMNVLEILKLFKEDWDKHEVRVGGKKLVPNSAGNEYFNFLPSWVLWMV